MQITSEPVDPRQVELTIVVSPERIERSIKEVAQQFASRQRIPGYRPGKVPLSRVVALYGEDTLREAAAEQLNEDVVREAIQAEGLRPSAPTTIEVVEKEPLTLRAMVPLEPEVDLGAYLEIRLPRPDLPEIDDDTVEQVIDGWRNELAALETADRPSEAGDTISLSLVGRMDDEVVFDDDALTMSLDADGAGQANVSADVVDELIGLSAGDTAQFAVTYSELWTQPELQGQVVSFDAEVISVMTLVAPELDDALAQELGGAETVDELRDRLRSQLQIRSAMDLHEQYVGQAVEALIVASDVSYPPVLLDSESAEMLAELRGRVERQGFTWDRWLELQEKDEDALWDEVKVEAEARLARRLVMTEFVQVEGIGITQAEVDAEVKQATTSLTAAARAGMPSVEDMRRSAGSRLLSNRAVDRLLEIVTADDGAADVGTDGDTPSDAPVPEVEGDTGSKAESEPKPKPDAKAKPKPKPKAKAKSKPKADGDGGGASDSEGEGENA